MTGRDSDVPPVLAPGLRILFCGVNPGLRSGETGHNFAGPSNRFWPTLHAAGLTPRRLRPEEDGDLPQFGLGIVNLVGRTTRAADELSAAELRAGARALEGIARDYAPRLVAMVGITAYRAAFARPKAVMGPQPETVGGRPLWVLPNPSGLNAHYTPADFARLYAEAAASVTPPASPVAPRRPPSQRT